MLSNLDYNRRNGVINDPDERENDQVGNDDEKVVTCGLRTVQPRACLSTLILADTTHDDWKKEAKDK